MKRELWPYFGVAVLALLLYAGMAHGQAGCPNGRCPLRPVSFAPASSPALSVASPAVAGCAAADGACGDEPPAVTGQDRFPVLKKVFRRLGHPLGGRFRR